MQAAHGVCLRVRSYCPHQTGVRSTVFSVNCMFHYWAKVVETRVQADILLCVYVTSSRCCIFGWSCSPTKLCGRKHSCITSLSRVAVSRVGILRCAAFNKLQLEHSWWYTTSVSLTAWAWYLPPALGSLSATVSSWQHHLRTPPCRDSAHRALDQSAMRRFEAFNNLHLWKYPAYVLNSLSFTGRRSARVLVAW
jgi:hypothetical protein